MASVNLTSTQLQILRDALETLICTQSNRYENYFDDDGTPVTESWFELLEEKLENA